MNDLPNNPICTLIPVKMGKSKIIVNFRPEYRVQTYTLYVYTCGKAYVMFYLLYSFLAEVLRHGAAGRRPKLMRADI